MLIGLLLRVPSFSIKIKEVADEILGFSRNLFELIMLKVKLALQDILDNFLVCFSRERHLAREHNVQHYSHGPNVTFLVVSLIKYFWSNVIRLLKFNQFNLLQSRKEST